MTLWMNRLKDSSSTVRLALMNMNAARIRIVAFPSTAKSSKVKTIFCRWFYLHSFAFFTFTLVSLYKSSEG